MMISAIVPVWNGRDLLARLLTTLEAQSLPVAELLIVDNGSTDGAPDLARGRGARVIAMGRNAGFAAGRHDFVADPAGQPSRGKALGQGVALRVATRERG